MKIPVAEDIDDYWKTTGGIIDMEPKLLPLTPMVLSDAELEKYEPEFYHVFSSGRIKNVAVSGAYGAGKSTVVESWENAHGAKNWIHVSLAHFQGTGDDKSKSVEEQVLSQLVHKIDRKDAPKSHFKKTEDKPCRTEVFTAFAITVFIVVSLILVWMHRGGEVSLSATICLMCLGVVWSVLVFFGVYKAVQTQTISRAIKRMKLIDAEIELYGSENGSILDKYTDDLVYLLSSLPRGVVVFEDLDRFSSTGIFEKLRVINDLVNDSRVEKEPIRFFYLIRDSLFPVAKDRTKFFDYIIPIIPFIDSSNSFEKLRGGFAGIGLEPKESFLYQLSLFVDDPRVLNDIVNETYHFKRVLFGDDMVGGDCERLVSMIAYKVLFPTDYEELQLGRGYVHSLFVRRDALVEWKRADAAIKREGLKKELDKVTSRLLLNKDELTVLYGAPRFSASGRYSDYNQRGEGLGTLKDVSDVVNWMRSTDDQKQLFADVERDLTSDNSEYCERCDEEGQVSGRRSDEIRKEIDEIERRDLELSALKLSELIDSKEAADAFFDLRKPLFDGDKSCEALACEAVLEDSAIGLIRFLIVGGWIDESYKKYMSYFYEGGLSVGDRNALMALLQAQKIDDNYVFDNPELAIEMLGTTELSRESSTNYSLFKHLLEYGPKEKREALLSCVKRYCQDEFLAGFVASKQYVSSMFGIVEKRFNSPIVQLIGSELVKEESKRVFCHRLMADGKSFLNKPEIVAAVGGFASADPRFLEVSDVDEQRVRGSLKDIGYCTTALSENALNLSLLRYVYEEGLYAPSSTMVATIMRVLLKQEVQAEDPDLATQVFLLEDQLLKKHVEKGIGLFICSLVGNRPSFDSGNAGSSVDSDDARSLTDSNDAIVWILNNKGLSLTVAKRYIERLRNGLVDSVEAVSSNDIVAELLNADVVASSSANIASCYARFGYTIDQHLGAFIERNVVPGDLKLATMRALDIKSTNFLTSVITSDDISASKLKRILLSYGAVYSTFSLVDVPDDKMDVLIAQGVILTNPFNLSNLREHYHSHVVQFASRDIGAYIKLVMPSGRHMPECDFSEEETLELFDMPISDRQKLRLLQGVDSSVQIKVDYSDKLIEAIIQTHFDLQNISMLPNLYAREGLREAVVQKIANQADSLIGAEVVLPVAMLREVVSVMVKGGRKRALRVAFLAGQFALVRKSKLIRSEVRSILVAAGLPEYVKLVDGPRSKIPCTSEDAALLDALKDMGMKSDTTSRPNARGYITAYSKGYTRQGRSAY